MSCRTKLKVYYTKLMRVYWSEVGFVRHFRRPSVIFCTHLNQWFQFQKWRCLLTASGRPEPLGPLNPVSHVSALTRGQPSSLCRPVTRRQSANAISLSAADKWQPCLPSGRPGTPGSPGPRLMGRPAFFHPSVKFHEQTAAAFEQIWGQPRLSALLLSSCDLSHLCTTFLYFLFLCESDLIFVCQYFLLSSLK